MQIFQPADILLPDAESVEMEKWAVIACDQFTSQQEYWEEAKRLTDGSPTALDLILPEAYLDRGQAEIGSVNRTMREYLLQGVFREYPASFVYVERTLLDGTVRRGLVGAVDLEQYDCSPDTALPVRASERTVLERIPPRMAIRRNAELELPHVLLLCDDAQDMILGCAEKRRDELPVLYDFDLMLGGGHISGRLVSGGAARQLTNAVSAYCRCTGEKYAGTGKAPVLFAVGDGNHSLASAKACYEELKSAHPDRDMSKHPARWALVELENLHDEAQRFEPIHRVITGIDVHDFLRAAERTIGSDRGEEILWVSGPEQGSIRVDTSGGRLPVAAVQEFLDAYLTTAGGKIDYIHGSDAVTELAQAEHTVGLLLPQIGKESFFQGIASGGVLPRKTFSMGHAQEKRYYIEARRIRAE